MSKKSLIPPSKNGYTPPIELGYYKELGNTEGINTFFLEVTEVSESPEYPPGEANIAIKGYRVGLDNSNSKYTDLWPVDWKYVNLARFKTTYTYLGPNKELAISLYG